ncbi:MAG: chemotaxis protein CheX [Agathobacter sp.]|nr:chemotaxis protein CheX [Agathobacter sp.]
MFSQFFGNYLFSNGHVTKEQLLPALARQSKAMMHVSTLALYSGYMSAQEIQHVIDLQEEEGKKFSEIAIKYGYLTQHQVMDLLNMKAPDFLILGQILINDGVFSYEEFENILTDYRSQTEFLDFELNEENRNDFHRLVEDFSIISEAAIPEFGKSYLELLFNNFVRYIGDDFSTLPPSLCTEFATECCVSQTIEGHYVVNTYFNMDEATAIAFAERYSGEPYHEVDEYVMASIEDLLNLHNGLFIVNASNDSLNELSIGVIGHHSNTIISFENTTYLFPICYPFGIIYFIMEIISI